MVLYYKKPGFWVTLIALVAAIAVGIFLLTSPKELTDLEKCEQGLKRWQELDAWQFQQTQTNVGGDGLPVVSQHEYWASGGEYLMKFSDAEDQGEWKHWKDGRAFRQRFGTLETGWQGDDFQESELIPWVMGLDWDALTIHSCEPADEGNAIVLAVEFPTLGDGTMRFGFDDNGKLRTVSRTFTAVDSTVCTVAIELVETDKISVEKQMMLNGVYDVLVQLYRELDRLQGMEYVHLIIDAVDDSDYPGWDTARQEFIRCGEDYYRNYDARNSAGTITTTYLKYGGVLHAREHSDEGLVPARAWEQITDRGFGENALLDRDWSRYQVLDIQGREDGSTVITLQGDLNDTDEYTTYFAKTYEFHLDPDGKLTTHIYVGQYRRIIDDYFAQGVFEGTHMATTYILDTPAEELQERIREVREEIVSKQPR